VKMLWGERRGPGTMGAVQRLPMEPPMSQYFRFAPRIRRPASEILQVRAALAHIPLSPCPSLHQLRRGSLRFVRASSYYDRVRLLGSVHHRLRLLTFLTRAGNRKHRSGQTRDLPASATTDRDGRLVPTVLHTRTHLPRSGRSTQPSGAGPRNVDDGWRDIWNGSFAGESERLASRREIFSDLRF
jgi:hypothetical protein